MQLLQFCNENILATFLYKPDIYLIIRHCSQMHLNFIIQYIWFTCVAQRQAGRGVGAWMNEGQSNFFLVYMNIIIKTMSYLTAQNQSSR